MHMLCRISDSALSWWIYLVYIFLASAKKVFSYISTCEIGVTFRFFQVLILFGHYGEHSSFICNFFFLSWVGTKWSNIRCAHLMTKLSYLQVLQIIPETMFGLLARIIQLQISSVKEVGLSTMPFFFFFLIFQDSKKTLFSPVAHNIASRYLKKKKAKKKSSSSSSHANDIFLTLCLTRFQPGWKRINWENMRNWMRDTRYVSVIIKDLYQKEPFNKKILPI